MSSSTPPPPPVTEVPDRLDITVRTGRGESRTSLSVFDQAPQRAGVADFNLLTLALVSPPSSRVRVVDARMQGTHGDVLFCVLARADAVVPGEWAWAGLGWCTDATGGGLFVSTTPPTRESSWS